MNVDTDDDSEVDQSVVGHEEDVTPLSDTIFIKHNKKISQHGNVFEGEIRSGVYGVRVCVIKFARKAEQNVREAEILTKLSHTHVISIINSGTHNDMFGERVYIALDKCHEQNLSQHLTSQKESDPEFNFDEALEYSKQIVSGVMYVHEKLIIHKDLKPSNILLTIDKSTIKLADFGLSQEIKSATSRVYSKHQFGTNGFRPPESFGNNYVSLKSDIFSLGVVFYYILSNGESPFGKDRSLWTYNTLNRVIKFSDLVCPNTKVFQHLIELMLSQERCRRPSIWNVADHPCWCGKQADGNFDYYEEENDDSEVKVPTPRQQESDDSETETENSRQLLLAMEEMGYNVRNAATDSIISEDTIVVCDRVSRHLLRFDPTNKSVTRIHEYEDRMVERDFSAVSIGGDIYVLMENRSVFRLKCSDITATWARMADLIEDHGFRPPAAVADRQIYVAGSSLTLPSKSVSKYSPLTNEWEKMKDKQLATTNAVIIALEGCVYCIGGSEVWNGVTNRVERLDIRADIRTRVWGEVASMQQARWGASAVEFDGKILIAGGTTHNQQALRSVESYDPKSNRWDLIEPMTLGHSLFRTHFINSNIYAFGTDQEDASVEKYDVSKNEWKVIDFPRADVEIEESVIVTI